MKQWDAMYVFLYSFQMGNRSGKLLHPAYIHYAYVL